MPDGVRDSHMHTEAPKGWGALKEQCFPALPDKESGQELETDMTLMNDQWVCCHWEGWFKGNIPFFITWIIYSYYNNI